MAIHVLATGAETNQEIEFQVYGANANHNATNPKNGSHCYTLDYNHIDVDGVFDIASHLVWQGTPTYRNWAAHLQLRLEAAPAVDVVLLHDSDSNDNGPTGYDVLVEVTTARKLKVTTSSGSTTGSTVLNTAQYYQIELRVDKTNAGQVYLRIDESDELDRAVDNNTDNEFTFGHLLKSDSGTDPAAVFRIDDVVLWVSTANELPPWLNTCNVHYRGVNAAGNYDEFATQTASATAHENVDEIDNASPTTAIDANYNQGGDMDTTKRQTHNVENSSPANTLKGITFFSRRKDDIATESDAAADTNFLSIRESGTDYETSQSASGATDAFTRQIGYSTLPSGNPLTIADIDALDIGNRTTMASLSDTDLGNNPGAQPPTSDFDGNPADAGDDDFTQVGGTGGQKWTVMNDNQTTTYLHSNTVGETQTLSAGLTDIDFTGAHIEGVILYVHIRGGIGAEGTGDGEVKLYYTNDSGTTKKYSDTYANNVGNKRYRWGKNPITGVAWVAADITGAGCGFGYEVVTADSTGNIRIALSRVEFSLVSELREEANWLITTHGDALSHVAPIETSVLTQELKVPDEKEEVVGY